MSLYRIDFTSWENDADHFCTTGVFLTSQEDVDFYKDLAEKFVSKNSYGYGNNEHDEDSLEELIEQMVEAYPKITQETKNAWLLSVGRGSVYDKLCQEILSNPVDYDYGFCRVYSSCNSFEILPGQYLEVNKKQAIFVKCENQQIYYSTSSYPVDEHGDVDIFKVQWDVHTCNLEALKDIKVISIPDNVSRKVAKLR